jgi:basic amino acid/polyamine antiporter, APA family
VLLNTDRSLSGLFEFTILVATAAMLVGYMAVGLAGLKLLSGPLRFIGLAGPLRFIGLAGTLYSLFALYASGLEATLWCFALIAAGWPVLLYARAKP